MATIYPHTRWQTEALQIKLQRNFDYSPFPITHCKLRRVMITDHFLEVQLRSNNAKPWEFLIPGPPDSPRIYNRYVLAKVGDNHQIQITVKEGFVKGEANALQFRCSVDGATSFFHTVIVAPNRFVVADGIIIKDHIGIIDYRRFNNGRFQRSGFKLSDAQVGIMTLDAVGCVSTRIQRCRHTGRKSLTPEDCTRPLNSHLKSTGDPQPMDTSRSSNSSYSRRSSTLSTLNRSPTRTSLHNSATTSQSDGQGTMASR